MIEKLKKLPLNLQATSVYDFNEFTLFELLNKFFKSINDCIEVSNESLTFLSWLKNEGLPIEVIKEINLMYDDGRLTEIINQLANDVNGKIVTLTNNVNEKILTLTTNVNNFKIETEEQIQEEITIINNKLPNIEINGGEW